ncbi:MAG: DUF6461 domain-containing protein [Kibdelosporangium sp.]
MGNKDSVPVVPAAPPNGGPAPLAEPDAEYRWVAKTSLSEAATITVVAGLTPEEVVTALGGDPSEPMSFMSIVELGGYQPVVGVLAVDGVVLAVEENGFAGADRDRLTALSRNGKAASLYWNINTRFQLSFAERDQLLYAGDPAHEVDAPHTEDLDFDDYHNRVSKGIVAIARFTGRGFTEEDLTAIYTADQAFLLDT